MPQGYSIHIGLNHVDASKYNGWDGTLSGCLNDAHSMQALAQAQGFTTQLLLDDQASSDNVLSAIGQSARNLQSGDTLLLTYSGHGGQVPDANGDENDGLDETWVCYDRMVLDDELYNLWGQFAPNVRIEVYSDSCHSGTVIREIMSQGGLAQFTAPATPMFVNPQRAARHTPFDIVHRAAIDIVPQSTAAKACATQSVARAIPAALALQLYSQHKAMYQALQFSRNRTEISASVILISGCQDNQVSQDGATNGLFTEKLLQVWNNGAFEGTLPQFHKSIVALMPPDQTPNYDTVGVDDAAFTNSKPLTIVDVSASPTTTTAGSTAPSVSGPGSLDRDSDGPPTFAVTLGSNPFYVFEITSDTENFGNQANRTAANFYGSWNDPNVAARMTSPSYTLPQSAWDSLKSNDRLYYRVGSTSSQTGWDNYLVSVSDTDAASSAPSIAITASAATSSSSNGSQKPDNGTSSSVPSQTSKQTPSISGPESYQRDSATGPTFTISSTQPYFVVEITSDPALFANQAQRSAATFFASWDDPSCPPRLGGTNFTPPPDAWRRISGNDALYYRVGATSSKDGWDNYTVSTSDADASTAPSITITAAAKVRAAAMVR